ncbi:MAG: YeiH family protein [Planctomycetaceae bacterium]|jgi:uncharacterized integral membrane protein (TIGR00698 family)|nr:YeiH family protein [Planctomycetaceae bacterium]
MISWLRSFFGHEDWLVIPLGGLMLLACTLMLQTAVDPTQEGKPKIINLLKGKIAKLESWSSNPLESIMQVKPADEKPGDKKPYQHFPALLLTWSLLGILLVPIALYKGMRAREYWIGYGVLATLGTLAFVMASQQVVKHYNFEYVLWALLLGLLISNTIGVPRILRPMLIGDTIIKLGLILLGAEVLFGKLLALGVPGILTSWIVTPVVLVTTYWFGQRILKMESPSLNMVISADMSVCGVSAAIATGAACRAKREEISYAIGISLLFTSLMMVIQPNVVLWSGMDKNVGAAWIGGTIDSTGAVAAAGAVLGKEALDIASTVKMIQNVLIGVIAFAVAAYWSMRFGDQPGESRIGIGEIWKRFPKFVLGFLGASLAFSFLLPSLGITSGAIDTVIKDSVAPLRSWLFCLAFVALGLETNFWELSKYLKEGKPLVLYLLGQTWSMLLSLLMAYLMFGVLYADKIKSILAK